MLIFEHSRPGRRAYGQAPKNLADVSDIPDTLRRKRRPLLPETSELQVVRHYTRLSQKNFSIDTHFYPPGFVHHEVQPAGLQQPGPVAGSA